MCEAVRALQSPRRRPRRLNSTLCWHWRGRLTRARTCRVEPEGAGWGRAGDFSPRLPAQRQGPSREPHPVDPALTPPADTTPVYHGPPATCHLVLPQNKWG